MFPAKYAFDVIKRKPGRVGANVPLDERFVIKESFGFWDNHGISEIALADLSKTILEMAAAMRGHDFSNPAKYVISAITLDSTLTPHATYLDLFRPINANAGHKLCRSTDALKNLSKITFDKVDSADAGNLELGLIMSTFEAFDVIFLVPNGLVLPHLTHHLNLAGGGDRDWGLELRLCDAHNFKSAPQITDDAFKIMFPGVPIDRTLQAIVNPPHAQAPLQAVPTFD